MVYCGTKHNNNYNQQNKQNLETKLQEIIQTTQNNKVD